MKNNKYFNGLILATTMLLFDLFIPTAGLGQLSASTIKINKKKLTMYEGESYTLVVKKAKKVKWSSDNKSVAAVNKKGVVTANSEGKAVITAKVSKKKRLRCKVKVKSRPFYVENTDITLTDTENISVYFNKKGKVYYEIEDTDIVTCEFKENWSENCIKLQLKSIRNGSTKIKLSNSVNGKEIILKVNVTEQEDCISELVSVSGEVLYPELPQNNYVTVTYKNSGTKDVYIPNVVEVDGLPMYSRATGYVDNYFCLNSGNGISIKYYTDVKDDTILRTFGANMIIKASVMYDNNNYIITN